jgi:hypothetical protein
MKVRDVGSEAVVILMIYKASSGVVFSPLQKMLLPKIALYFCFCL